MEPGRTHTDGPGEAEDLAVTPPGPRTAPDGPEDAPPAAVQEPLPFGPDEPIPYALTARARRFVAPEALPALSVVDDRRTAPDGPARERPEPPAVDGPVDLDDPHDTRPSQARALRRAGLSFAQIARELDVDPLVAQAWIDDVAPVRSARRRLRAVGSTPAGRRDPHGDAAEDVERRVRFERRRSEAAAEAADRLAGDAGFARGLGLVAGVVTLSEHAVLLTTRDADLAAAALRWIVRETEVPQTRIRVLLRLAPQVAGDAAAHAWAERLGLASERVAFTRWRGAPDAAAVEATIRLADPELAGTLAGWREALLGDLGGEQRADDREF